MWKHMAAADDARHGFFTDMANTFSTLKSENEQSRPTETGTNPIERKDGTKGED